MAKKSRKGSSGIRKDSGPRLDLTAQQWVVALLIGLATVCTATYGWRAAAIGSTAAYDDRQSISETISTEQETIDVALGVSNDTLQYTGYLADYVVAAELGNQAGALKRIGNASAASDALRQARFLRRSATERAADAGVFGRSTIADDLARPSAAPRPFSFEDQIKARTAEQQTGIDSPGKLDPGAWAAEANGIRDQINGLTAWALVMFAAVLLFTVAEANSLRRPVFYTAMSLGIVVLLTGISGGMTFAFFA
jgi:hypothetical protein